MQPEIGPEDKPKFHELFDYEYIIELTLVFWALLAAITITLYTIGNT